MSATLDRSTNPSRAPPEVKEASFLPTILVCRPVATTVAHRRTP
jgi:hypothetical protein